MNADHRPNAFIGSPIRRVEDLRFVQGRGEFIADLHRDGQLAAAFVRSTIAHGYLREIDLRAARAMPGVRAIFTAKDLAGNVPRIPFRRPNPSIEPYGQPAIACDKVRYVGEPVAIVLAETELQAEDAAETVEVAIDELPPMLKVLEAERSETKLFNTGTNVACVFTASKGEVGPAFAAADLVVAEMLGTQRQIVMPMETRGLLAEWNESLDHLQMFGAAKLPFFNRRAMASMMGLVETQVDYIELDVGGGFGARGEFYPEDFLVAFAARQLRRPVKWIEGRREHFLATGHARESEGQVEFAFRRDGTILGARGILRGNIGAYMRPNGTTAIRNMAQFLSGPYRIPNIHLEARGIVTNKTPAGTYRAPGRYESCLACETILDTAASKLGLDRLAIRRRNLLGEAEMPYPLATIAPADSADIVACDSGDYRQAFERCLVEAGWTEKTHLQGRPIDGRWHGLGIGSFIEGGASGPQENARIAIEDGRAVVYAGSSAVGQGLETVFSQIAADALEVPLAQVTVRHGSTTYLGDGWGSYGSRATVMGGCAVLAAAQGLLARFREAAAMRLRVEPATLRIANGRADSAEGTSLALCDMTGLACDGEFRNSKPTYTFGTAMAHVAVDPETGTVEVLDYLVVDDVGRIINPLTLHGQVQGAAIQGMGSVFREELVYDETGQLRVGSLMDYSVPLADDYPHVRCISQENYPSPNNPLGAKGAGEGGIIPVGAVIVNAVAAALAPLGVRPRQLPLTPFRLWTLIRDKTAAGERTD